MPEAFFKIKLQAATLLKPSLWHRSFPLIFAKCLITPFLQNSSGRLLLYMELSLCLSSYFAQLFVKSLCFPHSSFIVNTIYRINNKQKQETAPISSRERVLYLSMHIYINRIFYSMTYETEISLNL